MRVLRSKKKWLVVAVLALAGAMGVGAALATVTTNLISDTGAGAATSTRLRIQRNEFVPSADQPTFTSGWHTHPGPVIFQVQRGFLRLTDAATCRPHLIGPGETYIETPELPLVATADQAANWTLTLIAPADKALVTPASDPC